MHENEPDIVPDALSRSNETTKSTAFALACSVEKPKAEKHDETDNWYSEKMRQVRKRPEDHANWRIRDSQLYFFRPDPLKSSLLPDTNPWKLVVPKKLRPQVIKENHDELQAEHLGSEKTYAGIYECYCWPGLYSEVIKYVKDCKTCQRMKPSNQTKIGLMGKRLIEEPWTMVAAGILGPLPLSKKGKNQYILVFIDLFTKWVEIIPIKKANGKTIEAEFHRRIISRWGTPRVLHTDNGTESINKNIRELKEKFGMRHTKTSKYYAQANPTERYNRTIKQIIKAYLQDDHATWHDNADDLQFAINRAKMQQRSKPLHF